MCLLSFSLSILLVIATELRPRPTAFQHKTDVTPALISMKKSQTIYKEYKLQLQLHISVSVPIRPCKEDKGELVWEGGWIVWGQHKADGSSRGGGWCCSYLVHSSLAE